MQCDFATSKKEKLAEHLAWHEKANGEAGGDAMDKVALQNHTQRSSSSDDEEDDADDNSGGSGSNRMAVDEDAEDDEVARVTNAANLENGDDGDEDEQETSGRATQNGGQSAFSVPTTTANGGLGFLNMWMSAAPSLLDCYYAELLGAAANQQQTPGRTASSTAGAGSSLSARDSPRDDATGSGADTPSLLSAQKVTNGGGGGARNLDSPTSGLGQGSANKKDRRTDTCEYCGKVRI